MRDHGSARRVAVTNSISLFALSLQLPTRHPPGSPAPACQPEVRRADVCPSGGRLCAADRPKTKERYLLSKMHVSTTSPEARQRQVRKALPPGITKKTQPLSPNWVRSAKIPSESVASSRPPGTAGSSFFQPAQLAFVAHSLLSCIASGPEAAKIELQHPCRSFL